MTLRKALEDWTDWDGAAYELGCALSLIDPARSPYQTRAKHVFWTDHPVGNALHEMLGMLVELGVLERRDEPDDQYRWNPTFKGSWEP
jgi:hypothetical protein